MRRTNSRSLARTDSRTDQSTRTFLRRLSVSSTAILRSVASPSSRTDATDAYVIHDQAAGLVPEDAIDARNRLHQRVAAHRLINIERVQARHVKAGQPHVAHDDDPERV